MQQIFSYALIGICLALLMAPLAAASAHNLRDGALKITRALPNGAAAVTSDPIDTGVSTALGSQIGDLEYLLTAPALNATQLPNSKTMTYAIIMSDQANMSSPSTLFPSVIVQTGADGAGAAGTTFRFRLPSTAKRYIAFTATGSASGDATGASATLEVLA